MTLQRPTVSRRAVPLLALALVATIATGCDRLPGFGSDETTSEQVTEVNFGACFTAYGDDVLATAMNKAGTTLLYLTASQPATVPDEAWESGARAVVMVDMTTGQGRHLVLPWPAQEVIPVIATSDPAAERTPSPYDLTEQMVTLNLSETGDRFVVGVRRIGVQGIIAKLYAGVMPPAGGTEVLAPDSGLTLVPINDFKATEGIRSFALSPDGTKLAAVVGSAGEVRTYDFNTQQVSVYTQGPKGKGVEVTHELPLVSPVSTQAERTAAVANQGVMLITWSPQGDRLAIATDVPVNDSALALMDVATGRLTGVRRFKTSTVPQVAWAADGQSLFVMTTEVSSGSSFGNTAIRRIAAAEGGKDLTKGGQIVQPLGYNTEPANLVNFGDDQRFLFTWQGGLWRLMLQAGDLTKAAANKVSPDDAEVDYTLPYVSMERDQGLFLAGTGSNKYATLRDAISQESCAAGEAGEVQPTAVPGDTVVATAAPATAAPATAVPATTVSTDATAAATTAAGSEATAAPTTAGGAEGTAPAATAAPPPTATP